MLAKLTTVVPEVRLPSSSLRTSGSRECREAKRGAGGEQSIRKEMALRGVSQRPHPSPPSSRQTTTLSSGERVPRVSHQVYQVRPNLITKYVLPASFSLLTETKGEIRAANAQLLIALWRAMGPALNEHAATLSLPSQQRLSSVLAAAM